MSTTCSSNPQTDICTRTNNANETKVDSFLRTLKSISSQHLTHANAKHNNVSTKNVMQQSGLTQNCQIPPRVLKKQYSSPDQVLYRNSLNPSTLAKMDNDEFAPTVLGLLGLEGKYLHPLI